MILRFTFLRQSALFGGMLGLLYACVSVYEPDFVVDAVVLVVDGTLTDLSEKQVVKIARTKIFSNIPATVPVEGIQVDVLVNGQTTIPLREVGVKGQYEAPEGFRGKVGSTYQLRFQTAEGQRYESSPEMMLTAPPIEKVYDRFDAAGSVNVDKTRSIPANLVYIDFQDPVSEHNYYRWTWTLWERQAWCATCSQGIYNLSHTTLSGSCQTIPSLPANNLYDYYCLGSCWEIIRGLEINLFDDTFSNGRSVAGRLITAIPYYQNLGALVEIRQTSLSREAYRYYKLLADQSQNTGGLADTPPAPLIGNVRNLANAEEKITGFFGASSIASVRYWLDRQNVSGTPIGLFIGLNNRPPNPEPPVGTRPPAAACVPGETRTPVQPEGWQR